MIFNNQKHVFWQAFLLAAVLFIFGFLLGYAFESTNIDKIENYYQNSEISMMDILALNDMMNLNKSTCGEMILANIKFADRIYNEALILEKYESSGILNRNLELSHKKYDLLRTFLWIDSTKAYDKCNGNFNFVVYLYNYDQEDLTLKAEQRVWSNILYDLKQKQGGNVVLIPIAVDSNLISLNSMVENFNIKQYPVVIINNEQVITELSSVNDIEKYLK
jgi:hypothetical protein